MNNAVRIFLLIFLLSAVVSAQDNGSPVNPAGPTLAAVQARGQLICGVDEEVFGFGFLNPNTGEISGLQIDFCRALAAATTGEAEAVELRLHPIGTPAATLINSGVDVLFDHTFNLDLMQLPAHQLDSGQAALFYDGASALVEAASGLTDLEALDGATVCLLGESASASAFNTEMARRDLDFDAATFATIAEMRAAFEEGRCTAQILDRSLLEIIRQSSDSPDTLTVWPMPFTRRAIVPLLRYGDPQWRDLVDWTLWGLIQAEHLGITSQNIAGFRRQPNETDEVYLRRVGDKVAALLDGDLGLGHRLGLTPDFMYEVLHQVGNYGEIYERNLGPDSSLPIERGLNSLWADGGFLDAPLWR